MHQVADRFDLTSQLEVEPAASVLPAVKGEINNSLESLLAPPAELAQQNHQHSQHHHHHQPHQPAGEWTAEYPFHATVTKAKWLTVNNEYDSLEGKPDGPIWGECKRVVHMTVSTYGSGIQYAPGDSIGVCCPNPAPLVLAILHKLQQAHPEAGLTFDSRIYYSENSNISRDHTVSLGEFLRYKIDLVGVPARKASLLALASYCKDAKEASTLKWLCSKGALGKQLWNHFVVSQRLGLGEILLLFPSCIPSLPAFIAATSPMPPRLYSVASSPMTCPHWISVAFSVVRYECGLPEVNTLPATRIQRSGVCTKYLEDALAHWLHPSESSSSEPVIIRVFPKPTLTFHLPGSVAPPLILIGPGTGVAPFIGFLEHRALLEIERKESMGKEMCCGVWRGCYELEEKDLPPETNQVGSFIKSVEPGPIHLFFGCRGTSDYLFKDSLARRLEDGTLSTLEVAMSRIGPEKVYVTHKIMKRGDEIARALLEEGAHVFICGDGNAMAKDVGIAFKRLLCEHGGMTEVQASEYIADMKQRRKYVMDIWS